MYDQILLGTHIQFPSLYVMTRMTRFPNPGRSRLFDDVTPSPTPGLHMYVNLSHPGQPPLVVRDLLETPICNKVCRRLRQHPPLLLSHKAPVYIRRLPLSYILTQSIIITLSVWAKEDSIEIQIALLFTCGRKSLAFISLIIICLFPSLFSLRLAWTGDCSAAHSTAAGFPFALLFFSKSSCILRYWNSSYLDTQGRIRKKKGTMFGKTRIPPYTPSANDVVRRQYVEEENGRYVWFWYTRVRI